MQSEFFVNIIVFLIVFSGYLITSFLIGPSVGQDELENLPALFKLLPQKLWAKTAENFGKTVASLFPKNAAALREKILCAGIRMPVEYVYAAQLIFAFLMLFSGGFFSFACFGTKPAGLFFVFIAMIAGLFYPAILITSAMTKRKERITRTLPFAIDLIGAAIRSGIDFVAAIRYYVNAENPSEPLAVEFKTMLKELELGKTRLEAIDDMARRIRTDEFYSFASSVCHGIEVGASIVETLKIQAEEMRRVRYNAAERKAARAASAMAIPIMLLILPAMFIVIGAPVIIRLLNSGMGEMLK